MDQREYVVDWEETIRTAFAGLMAGQWHAMPGRVTTDSPDGHTATVQPTVKRLVTDVQTGQRSYEDHPVHPDVPIKFASGGGITHTFPIQTGLEGLLVYANRDFDGWHQSGGTQQPVTDRMHGYADPIFIPGIRSDPRKLQAVSTTSSQIRSEDGHQVTDHDPTSGVTHFSADPSTAPASATFNPFLQAVRFVRHAVQGASGLLGQVVNGSTIHDHGLDFLTGPFMRANNALHSVLCHPTAGPSLNAANLLHSVLASPTLGAVLSGNKGASTVTAGMSGVQLASTSSISLSCPAGGLSLPAGSVGGSSLGAGAASSNVGALGGDLAGDLPAPQVVGILQVANANMLPNAANDAAAAALVPPVAIGSLYRNGSALMVRVA